MRKLILGATLMSLALSMAWASDDPSPEHVKAMKAVGAANGALRKGEDVEKNATALAAAYKSVAPFWMAKNSDIAAKSLHEGIQGAEAAAAAAKAGNQDAVATALKTVGGTCRTCHDAHREKVSENVYKIK